VVVLQPANDRKITHETFKFDAIVKAQEKSLRYPMHAAKRLQPGDAADRPGRQDFPDPRVARPSP
jgi:hypothetical protein